jgi:L-cysteine:1D-myo-inositol 2-amino-2-deoxy-alpha-D-glucopyranoside ligase
MEPWPAVSVPELPGRAPETQIWDTASGAKVVAAPDRLARLYACGITPYDATHMGHAATYLAWDLLVRAWHDAGHDVAYVQNITDVDDPLLERAARDGEDWRELADREIALFRSDMAALRVLPPDHFIGAVEALPLIEELNRALANAGALYDLDGDTYFARSADPAFGSVSGLDAATMAELSAERGGDPARPGKKDPLDPLVWMAARPGEPSWASDLGRGRPGWHVECAAIATRYLGDAFEVQAGGTDLIYPHHEMSASHARVALGPHAFARRYAHAGMVRLDGEKMSKSRGNLVFVSRLLADGTDPMVIRLALLAHHYRQDWDWSDEVLATAAGRLERWRTAARMTRNEVPGAGPARPEAASAGAVLAGLRERIADDLDAPGALAIVDQWAAAVADGEQPGAEQPGARPADTGPDGAGEVAAAEPAAPVHQVVDAILGVRL